MSKTIGFLKWMPMLLSQKTNILQLYKVKPLWYVMVVYFLAELFGEYGLEMQSNATKEKYYQAKEAIGDWGYPKSNMNIDGLKVRFIKGTSNENVLFLGASHIEHTYPYIKKNNEKYNIYYLTMGGCSAVPSAKHPRWSCENLQRYKELVEKVKFKKIVTSIYCAYCAFDKYSNDEVRIKEYNDFVDYIINESEEVFLIKSEPYGEEFNPRTAVRYNLDDYVATSVIKERLASRNDTISKVRRINEVKVIDPVEYLCQDICKTKDSTKGFYYKDNSHMRPSYAKTELKYLDDIIKN